MSHRPPRNNRRSAWTAAAAFSVVVWAVSSQAMTGLAAAAPPAGNKITICHVPPGNPENAQTIEVDENGWNGHQNHEGDYEGACLAPTTTTTARPTTTTARPTTTSQAPTTTARANNSGSSDDSDDDSDDDRSDDDNSDDDSDDDNSDDSDDDNSDHSDDSDDECSSSDNNNSNNNNRSDDDSDDDNRSYDDSDDDRSDDSDDDNSDHSDDSDDDDSDDSDDDSDDDDSDDDRSDDDSCTPPSTVTPATTSTTQAPSTTVPETTTTVNTTTSTTLNPTTTTIDDEGPEGHDSSFNVDCDDKLSGTVLSGDEHGHDDDESDDATSVTLVDDVLHGVLSLNSDGSFTYTPDEGFSGLDSFTYKVSDEDGDESDLATAVITVADNCPVPTTTTTEAPTTTVPETTTTEAPTTTVPETTTTTEAPTTTAPETTTTEAPTTTAPETTTTEAPTTTVPETTTTEAPTTTTQVPVTLLTTPVAVDDDGEAECGAQITGFTRPNDSGEGEMTTVLLTNPAHGSVVLNPDGSYVYTPDDGFCGTDSFTYQLSDGAQPNVQDANPRTGMLSNVATVTLRYQPATPTTSPEPSVLGETTIKDTPDPVLTVAPATAPPAAVLGISATRGSLATTGSTALPVALAGLTLLLVGSLLTRMGRKD